MGPIGNMHVNDDTFVGFGEHGYNRANEEPNDNYYNDVSKDHGEENRNDHGCNNNSNNRGEGGASGIAVGGNTDATSVDNGDGGPNHALRKARRGHFLMKFKTMCIQNKSITF